jgi:hypothetical protein
MSSPFPHQFVRINSRRKKAVSPRNPLPSPEPDEEYRLVAGLKATLKVCFMGVAGPSLVGFLLGGLGGFLLGFAVGVTGCLLLFPRLYRRLSSR